MRARPLWLPQGFGSAWHLAKIEVVNTNTGEQAVFPYNNVRPRP